MKNQYELGSVVKYDNQDGMVVGRCCSNGIYYYNIMVDKVVHPNIIETKVDFISQPTDDFLNKIIR